MIDVHYASLTSQGVQHTVFYRDGHPSRYQPRPTGLNFGEQTGTSVFPLVIAVTSEGNTWMGDPLGLPHALLHWNDGSKVKREIRIAEK